MVAPDETTTRILEIDGIRNGAQEAVEEIPLVEKRVFCGLQSADVDERQHDTVDYTLRTIRKQAQEE